MLNFILFIHHSHHSSKAIEIHKTTLQAKETRSTQPSSNGGTSGGRGVSQ